MHSESQWLRLPQWGARIGRGGRRGVKKGDEGMSKVAGYEGHREVQISVVEL